MPDSHLEEPSPVVSTGRVRLQRLLFGGVYGTVLASSLASALDDESGRPDPGYDALWILVACVTAAAAHGYAHAIAHWSPGGRGVTTMTVRSVGTEWPLVAAAVPTLFVLLGAYAHWWGESGGIEVVLLVNTAALFCWGLWAARLAGQGWGAACRVGGVDLLIGLVIITVNSASH
ncbi:hypothetical protein [Actinacidiphila acidipaludis]|uniref:hypothetical protein n=1 Tax=Actinacidiphila acidipaludis TaxID=2873382 RepID=UPI0027E06C78|nr:hypothetical protein [Streptomyces acidipaludis]